MDPHYSWLGAGAIFNAAPHPGAQRVFMWPLGARPQLELGGVGGDCLDLWGHHR